MIDFRKIPFTYHWILDRAVGEGCKTVLDVGCGDGATMMTVSKGKKWKITGIDIHGPTLEVAKKRKIYKEVVKGDLSKFPKKITQNKYDLVFCSQVVEHLKKKEALELIRQCESVAAKRIVISTTVGFMEFHPLEMSEEDKNNPFQRHLSGWTTQEFAKRGYVVRGQGIGFIYRDGNLAHKLPKVVFPILQFISMLFAPLVWYIPELGTYQVCHKKI